MSNEGNGPKSFRHTIVLSDLHLTDAELGQPGRSLWKRYKRPKYFIDRSFKNLLQELKALLNGQSAELVLNGDIFDFDSVMRLPLHSAVPISWLEQRRGLFPEEEKSRFKMEVILSDHAIWLEAIRDWVMQGHDLVFVIGNHDLELHWPAVQREIFKRLQLTSEQEQCVRFCEWFYISEKDTLIEHGNQYDDYCVSNPVHPLVKKGRRIMVRLPFGNITSRYMVNGMGLFNPHVESSFLMTLPEYIRFFYRYALRVQPLLPFTWFWSAAVSFWEALGDGFLPAMRDPLYFDQRVEEIAKKSNATPTMVRTLRELHTHPAVFNPLKIARELWLDRIFIFFIFVGLSFFIFSVVRVFTHLSFWWGLVFLLMLLPVLVYYARNIKTEVFASLQVAMREVPMIAKITSIQRVVFGHTHRAEHTEVGQTEVLNTGTWSPAFKDPECTQVYGRKCFAWIKPTLEGIRMAELYVWKNPGFEVMSKSIDRPNSKSSAKEQKWKP